jgi:hypothetical protein
MTWGVKSFAPWRKELHHLTRGRGRQVSRSANVYGPRRDTPEIVDLYGAYGWSGRWWTWVY